MRQIKLHKAHKAGTDIKPHSLKLPHELDLMTTDQSIEPQPIMRQAYDDLLRGLVDTDMHGERGVEEVQKNTVQITIRKSQRISKRS